MGLGATRAKLLQHCIWLLLGTTTLGLVTVPLIASDIPFIAYVLGFTPFYLVYIGGLLLLQSGRARAAAWALVLSTLVLQIFANALYPGLAEQALVSFINLILIAGFTLSRGAAIFTTLVASIGVIAYLILRQQQLLLAPTMGPVIGSRLPAVCITVLTTGGLVVIALKHVTLALNRERLAKSDALRSSLSLARALEDNALRARLSEHLVLLGRRMLESREQSQQIKLLLEQCIAVDGFHAVELQDQYGQVLSGLNESASTLSVHVRVKIPGLQPPRFLSVLGNQELVNSEAAVGFLNTAVSLLAEATARATAETHLQHAEQVQTIGRLSAGVAHDFNNLLTAIAGGVGLAKLRIEDGQSCLEALESVQAATERAMGLTQRMMAFNNSSARERVHTEIKGCINDIALVFRQTVPRRIDVEIVQPIPNIVVAVDRIELEQILLNLVHNASNAIVDRGHIQIRVEGPTPLDPHRVGIHVSDNGCGMTAEVQQRIYEPFFTTRGQKGGHGLGLTGVKALIDRLQGEIELTSMLDVGTRFSIRLPISVQSEPLEGESEEPTKSQEANTLQDIQILLVEDDPLVREVVEIMLQTQGAIVHVVDSGEQALEVLKDDRNIELLISDVLMPGIDGHELLRQARTMGYGFPAILVSGFDPRPPGDLDALAPCRRLAKPFTLNHLIQVLGEMLPQDQSL